MLSPSYWLLISGLWPYLQLIDLGEKQIIFPREYLESWDARTFLTEGFKNSTVQKAAPLPPSHVLVCEFTNPFLVGSQLSLPGFTFWLYSGSEDTTTDWWWWPYSKHRNMCADPHLWPQDHICLLDVFCTSKSQNDFVVTGFASRLLIHVLGLVFIHKRVTETLIARTAEFPTVCFGRC